jgi:deoxyribose-phosphate aldolase
MSIAAQIDHTLLKADTSRNDIRVLCNEAIEHEFASICIPPYFVQQAARLLDGTKIKVCTVAGFPLGYSNIPAKVEEIKRAVNEGAHEIDVMINICAIKSEAWSHVRNEVDGVTMAAHMHGKVIKIIIETALLTQEEIKKVCEICGEVNVNYVKTSTGFHSGADVKTIKLLREHLPKQIKIKASGGIATYKDAKALLEAGADRIGTSKGIQILREEK